MTKEPVRWFGYTTTGLILLAISIITAFLKGADWKDGLLAALAVLAGGVAGTEQLRARVWSPLSHRTAIDDAVRPTTVKAPGPRPIRKATSSRS